MEKGKRDIKRQNETSKQKKEQQINQFVQAMVNYSLPIKPSGKSILGAYTNVAQDNFSKTLQYIYGKIGLKVNSSNYFKVLEQILVQSLSPEQNDKLRTLLFHHFSVLAPILGSMKSEEISKEIENGKSSTDEKAIVKQVKDVVKSAHINDCLSVLVCLSKALKACRNLHSHYRAYNKQKNQIKMYENFASTATYLTNALKASALICQSNAGANAKQYEFITGEYHYKEKKGCKIEYDNYYYRIKGERPIIKANDKTEPNESNKDAISDFGLVYLTSLFLSKSDTEMMLDKLRVFKNSPFKGKFNMEKDMLTSSMAVYRINIPKGKRLKMEDDNVQLCMDMLNELQKCPHELYKVITQKGKDSFRREQMEPVKDPETGEYKRDSTDGTGNIVYKGKGVYSLLVRKDDRFPYFALRYIDNRGLFPTIRFQIDLGYYRFAFYPKTRIDGTEETRILQKRINGFGKLVETEYERLETWGGLFQESEIKKPNETDKAEIAQDEEGNIIEIEQLVKANGDTQPFVTDKRASYNFHSNRIGLYWKQDSLSGEDSKPYVPHLNTKLNDKKQPRPDVSIITPLASLSVHDLPALIFYEYLREGKGTSAEEIIKKKYEYYKNFFQGIANKTIKNWSDVEQLKLEIKKKDIPEKFWPYLDNGIAGSQTNRIVNNYIGKDVVDRSNKYHFIGHIQEQIDYLKKEIKKFNDICLKMATTNNEYGADDYKAFRPASLARKMGRSVMEWLPAECPAKKIMTGVEYGVMSSVLSQFGSDGKDIGSLKTMFIKGGIIADDKSNNKSNNKSNYHPFLDDVLNNSIKNMENLYIEYISKELKHIESLREELECKENEEDKRAFIQEKLPFAKLTRKRFDNRDESYYRQLAERYLTIDNSENGGDKSKPAIILLPDGLFTEHIFKLLQEKHNDVFTGNLDVFTDNPDKNPNNNASYLISTYFEKITKDESQNFYQCFSWQEEERKPDSKFNRHYEFFDYYDNPKLLEENDSGNSKDKKKKNSSASEVTLSQQEINEKLKDIKRESILKKKEKYVQFEKAKIERYKSEKEANQSKLEATQNRLEKQWLVYSTTKKEYFRVYKDKEIGRLEKKLKKLDQMISNSKKIERIEETYAEKLISLKNECQRTERVIRRYRIEDIVTYYMVSTYFKEIFKNTPEDVKFKLQDVGSDKFVKGSDGNEAFLDKTVPFSRKIPVTFAFDENDMLKKNWEKKDGIKKITMDCEVFLNRIAIRNYNLALSDLNDERLFSFLTHYACMNYWYGAKQDTPLRINYNRLSLEFKMYNQLRPDIFEEVHAIEKIIVDKNTTILNDDQHRDFFIPMTKEECEKEKNGMTVERQDKDAKRNSFVNLLALVFSEHNEKSVYANNVRKAAAHNHYGILFKELAEDQLLFKIIRAYQLPDKSPNEPRLPDKNLDLSKDDPHSFAALILRKIEEIRKDVENELTNKTAN